MRPLNVALLAVLIILVMIVFGAGPARSAEPAPQLRYYGTTPEGVRIYQVCIEGQWVNYSAKAGGDFHILAPFIQEAGIGIDLPTCKGGKAQAGLPEP